ncbi:MAG: hypothetical protein VYC39_16455 [Myxococcota bacterium]|nr:hypothetical protein [Myxococcota bacterium]
MLQTGQHAQDEPNAAVRQVYVRFLSLVFAVVSLSCSSDIGSQNRDRGANFRQEDASLSADQDSLEDLGVRDIGAEDSGFREDALIADGALFHDAASIEDAGPVIDASTAAFIEVGTGDTQFVPISNSDVVPFALGPQGGGSAGGYHVWLAFRSQGYVARNIDVTVALEDPSNNIILNSMSRRLDLQPLGSYFGLFGIRLVLPDCCAVRGKSLRFRVTLNDTNQQMGSASQDFTASNVCPDIDGNDIC